MNVRFRGSADMGRRIASIISAAFDPERSFVGFIRLAYRS